jgi:hypothetical protein
MAQQDVTWKRPRALHEKGISSTEISHSRRTTSRRTSDTPSFTEERGTIIIYSTNVRPQNLFFRFCEPRLSRVNFSKSSRYRLFLNLPNLMVLYRLIRGTEKVAFVAIKSKVTISKTSRDASNSLLKNWKTLLLTRHAQIVMLHPSAAQQPRLSTDTQIDPRLHKRGSRFSHVLRPFRPR